MLEAGAQRPANQNMVLQRDGRGNMMDSYDERLGKLTIQKIYEEQMIDAQHGHRKRGFPFI